MFYGHPILEAAAGTLKSCVNAERGGAGRIELCGALGTGGLTPGAGLLKTVKKHVSIPVFVMIRPREGNFCYDGAELEVMRAEIDGLKESGADGFVFGILNENGTVNAGRTSELVRYCAPLPVTFHRAIDLTPDLLEALDPVMDAGCARVLTSGGKPTAPEGIKTILALLEKAKGGISVLPGSGIRAATLAAVFHPGFREYHLSGRKQVNSPIQSTLFEMNWLETDENAIRSASDELLKLTSQTKQHPTSRRA